MIWLFSIILSIITIGIIVYHQTKTEDVIFDDFLTTTFLAIIPIFNVVLFLVVCTTLLGDDIHAFSKKVVFKKRGKK